MGVKALRKIQMGQESTAGTAVAATALWRGRGVLEDMQDQVSVEEDVGMLIDVDRTYVPKKYAGLSFESIEATFEQLPYIFQAGINDVAGVQDGAGTDYIWTWNLPTTSANTPQTFTLEMGDDQAVEEMEYAFIEKLTLEGKAGEAWMMGADWRGRKVSTSAFTGSISLPTVEEMLFSKTKLYIDDVGGSIGTTQKSNTLMDAALELTTGFVPIWAAHGDEVVFAAVKQVKVAGSLKITFEHDSIAVAEKANWRAQTPRLIRLLCEGDAVATPGTTYSNKTMIIDLAGKWETFDALSDSDGNDTVVGNFKIAYNATAALAGQFVIVNELSTLA